VECRGAILCVRAILCAPTVFELQYFNFVFNKLIIVVSVQNLKHDDIKHFQFFCLKGLSHEIDFDNVEKN
jgi:hypothetical protein